MKKLFKILGVVAIATIVCMNVNLSPKSSNESTMLANISGIAVAQAEGSQIDCALISSMICKIKIFPYYQEYIGYPIKY